MKISLKQLTPYVIAIAVFVLFTMVFFYPQFQGKVVEMGDIVQHVGMSKEIVDHKAKTGEATLWTNSMFGGMPAYQISYKDESNKLQIFFNILALGFDRPAGYFIMGLISFFILLLSLRINIWLAVVGSIMFAFIPTYFILFEAGHTSKLLAVFTLPLVLAGIFLIFRKEYLIGFPIFTLGLGMNILANHPQMTYYFGMTSIALFIGFGIKSIMEKEYGHLLRSAALLLVGGLLAFASSYGKLKSTYDYAKETMRGGAILTSDAAKPDSGKLGLQFDYAMQWSNNSADIISSFIPYFAGGGSGEWVSKKSKFAKTLGQKSDFQAPTYWGGLPGTSGPNYLGIIPVLLFVFGMFVYKGSLKWWLFFGFILTLLLSTGKYFSVFNEFLFDNFPLFNKFRAPNSVLAVTSIFVSILAILGLNSITKETDKSKFIKPLYYSLGIVGGFCLLMALMGTSLFTLSSDNDEQYKNIIEPLMDYRAEMLTSSAWRNVFLCLVAAGILWLYLKDKISLMLTSIGVLLIILFDLIPVSTNYLNEKNFVSEKRFKNTFEPRPVDAEILKDNDPNYRVYDATISTFSSATASYFHKTIGGYSAVKLQRYQDLIERQISKGNQNVLNMLNTKYFIFNGQDQQARVQQNPNRFGNAWFVDTIVFVKSPNEEIDSLNNISSNFAVVSDEYKDYVGSLNFAKNGTITLQSYAPNKLVYKSETSSDQLAVFSEIWYGPNKGWQAYIDDKEVEHIRVNYLLRGLKIPAGNHTIRFEFQPQDIYIGQKISLISSLLIILILISVISIVLYRKRSN